ncbi:tRNA (adenosine(37)-N6)-threonylcarbamoyltransferase complex transferase subunit TsaD [Candidatus Woesearchaeota archaeon]|nr:tRNA (adenosine(37)-N6)-threonylcarbamoyltransferase complex transferase subunit TsaD [Candidatus Woesearchaeota archaeon]
MGKLICMGIESTAHTFGVGIINNKRNILADARDMYTTEKGGIIPSDAANHHRKLKYEMLNKALEDANLYIKDIDFIAFSQGPGLPPSLLVGKDFAKELTLKYKKPLVGVNHLCGHLEEGKFFTKAKDPVFVFVSGANTQIIAHEGEKYRIFGEALSVGLGNALDKFGRAVGLGFPAGPKIEQLAKKGKYIEIPYVVKGMDVEFSGIVTHCINLYKKGVAIEDLCYSLQETGFAMLIEVTERALAHTGKKEALLIGGVAANQRFIEMLNTMCKERGVKSFACPLKYSGDNGIQIAIAGMLQYNSGYNIFKTKQQIENVDINPNWRIDDVETPWMKN